MQKPSQFISHFLLDGKYPELTTNEKAGGHAQCTSSRRERLVALLATAALLVLGLRRLLGRLLRGLLVDGVAAGLGLGRLGHRLGPTLGPGLAPLVGLPLPALEVAGRERRHGRTLPRRRPGHDGLRSDGAGTHLPRGAGEVPLEDLEHPRQRVQPADVVELRDVAHTGATGDELADLRNRGELPFGELQLLLDLPDPQHEPVPGRDLTLVHLALVCAFQHGAHLGSERRQRNLHCRGHVPPP